MSESKKRVPPKGGSGTAPPRKSLMDAFPPIKCGTCRFWFYADAVTPDDFPTEQCRRYSPMTDKTEGHRFPEIGSLGWCGEWEAKR